MAKNLSNSRHIFYGVKMLPAMFAIGALLLMSTEAVGQFGDDPNRPSGDTAVLLTADQVTDISQRMESHDRQQVLQALEYLKQIPPQDRLRGNIKTLAERGPDSIVRGYARLLAADWGIALNPSSADLNSYDPLRKPISHGALGSERGTPELATNRSRRSSQPSSRPKENLPAVTGLTDSTLPHSSTTPIGSSFAETPEGVDLISSVELSESTSSTRSARSRKSPSSFSLTPQQPFWAANASFESSVPSDAGTRFSQLGYETENNAGAFQPLNDMTLQAGFLQDGLGINPQILDRPLNAAGDPALQFPVQDAGFLTYERDAPLGFTGKSGVIPTEFQTSDHFVPIEDRWRLGFPKWDRYGTGHQVLDDYPFKEGSILDPYNQNVIKGDFPIIGQHTFYAFTAESLAVHEFRQTPTATTPFESTSSPFSGAFFGNPDQLFYAPFFKFQFNLFHGNEAFKPMDWQLRLTPIINANYLDVEELAIVNPDVRRGTTRLRGDVALEEYFIEAKLADIGPDYDFVSARVGSQFFVSDFRGFIFRDINRGARVFGTRLSNRDQFNLVWFDQQEKDTNSGLNTFDDRHQNVVVANYFRQDFVYPGYTAQASFHYNRDQPSVLFDNNDNLVRPDPVGIFKPHQIDAYYFGVAGDGHIGRINVQNQLYYVIGEDSANPIGGTEQEINAQMAAFELSYDRDWIRFRTSYFFASGDDDTEDGKAEGFDTILDNPIFAGGEFSYWQRQAVRLFGTNLTQARSLVPNLRSSKTQGQSNFVNPGLHLFNIGADVELTPKTRVISNANFLYFDETAVLETYTFQDKINREIGTDLSIGVENRPLLNDNVILIFGVAALLPDRGLKDLFGTALPDELAAIGVGNELKSEIPRLTSVFVEVVLTY